MAISSITDFPRNEPGLVDTFVGTAYDVVKGVYDALPEIHLISDQIDHIPEVADAAVEVAMGPARLELQANIDKAQAWAEGGVPPNPNDPASKSAKSWADDARVSAGEAAKINLVFPFAFDSTKAQYDVTVISGRSDITTAGMGLWVGGQIIFDYTIDSLTKFTLTNPTIYPHGTLMRLMVNAKYEDMGKNLIELEEVFTDEFEVAQAQRAAIFEDFLEHSSYEIPVAYTNGLVITRNTQLVTYLGYHYRVKASALPLVTSNWATDSPKMELVAENKLRDDLLAPSGASLVGDGDQTLAQFLAKLRDPDGTANGISQIAKGMRWFSTIAELRTSVVGVSGMVGVMEDGRGGFFKVDATVVVDNDINQYVSAGGVGFRRMYDGPINVRWAGAKCDKVTDDRAAIQKVIDWCSNFADWPAISIPGPSLLVGSLSVNREVILHTDRAEWRVYGIGGTGGLHRADATVPMFTSTFGHAAPTSAWITFVDMRFTSPDRALGVKVLSDQFLQIKFLNCYFLRVRCMQTTTYVQSMYFENCNLRYTSGIFLSAPVGYDVHYVGCISEYGESFLNSFITRIYGFSFSGGLHEGAFGGVLLAGGANGINISGNYFEFNQAAAIDLRAGDPNQAVVVSGNFFATAPEHLTDVNFYEILWGNTTGAVSTGNFQQNGRLHDNSMMDYEGMDSFGDYAALTLFKSPILVSRYKSTWTPTASGAMTVVQALVRREGNLIHVDFIFQFPAGGSASGCTIAGLPYPAASLFIIGFVGYADLPGSVFIMGGSAAPNGTPTAFSLCKDRQGTRYTMAELNGVQIAGTLTYSL